MLVLRYFEDLPEAEAAALLDPTQCFGGFAAAYVLHALPVLVRPSRRTAGALLRWETRGRALDPAWSLLQGLAAEQPSTGKLVTRPRPAADRLRELRVPTLVLLAGRSRAHDVDKVGATARRLLPQLSTTVLCGGDPSHPSHEPGRRGRPRTSVFPPHRRQREAASEPGSRHQPGGDSAAARRGEQLRQRVVGSGELTVRSA